jgi:hypothetical protein
VTTAAACKTQIPVTLSGSGTGPVTCPECGEVFTGTWASPYASAPQECPSGHVVTLPWPGWEAAAPSS